MDSRASLPYTAAFVQAADPSRLSISVGFADSTSISANFPTPWKNSPNINFYGGGSTFQSGAIRIDNSGTTDLTIDDVNVDIGNKGGSFDLWQGAVVPAGGSAILTQTAFGNFNTSAATGVSCGQSPSTSVPKITLTIAGASVSYFDTAHVLDTGGMDSSCRGNQSLAWRPIGTVGPEQPAASIALASASDAAHAANTPDTLNVQVNDAAGEPLANAPISVNVVNGLNAGQTFTQTSEADGTANVTYSSTVAGSDTLVALLPNFSGGNSTSEKLQQNWTTDAACPVQPEPSTAQSRLIYVGQQSVESGDSIQLAGLLTDGNGVPLSGRSLQFAVDGNTSQVAPTDGTGVASIASTLSAGAHTVQVNYSGDSNFSAITLGPMKLLVTPRPTVIRYTGNNLLSSAGTQTVSAKLTDALVRAVPGAVLSFTLGGSTATANTDINGNASTTLTLNSALNSGPAQLQITFAGTADDLASSRNVPVELYLSMPFVAWGGNSNGLKVGDTVNFWGNQWSAQVSEGNYGAHSEFKGWAGSSSLSIGPCQPSATLSTLTDTCWQVKPGQSSPPSMTLPAYIEIIIATAINEAAGTDYGNIACGAVVKVNQTPPEVGLDLLA